MHLFPNQIRALESVIELVVQQGAVLDSELKKSIDFHKKWGAKDRRNFYQAAYDIVRHYELLAHIAQSQNKSIIGAYISNPMEHALDYDQYKKDSHLDPSIQLSIPDKLYALYQNECEHSFENIQAMQQPGKIYLRINTSLLSLDAFAKKLSEQEIPYDILRELNIYGRVFHLDCIQLHQRTQTHRQFFQENQMYYEIQDLGSQIITEFMDFTSANTIVESCAGNGGKTTHILDKTRKQNPLHLACDKERKKLEQLQLRIQRWPQHKVVVEVAKEKVLEKYKDMANILCMDVPCTGSGTLKRQPDIKYRINEDKLAEKVKIQRELFHLFDSTLQSGGQLLYSTCSLFRSENELQVDYFINHGYELEDKLLLQPKDYPGDGFFMARLVKK